MSKGGTTAGNTAGNTAGVTGRIMAGRAKAESEDELVARILATIDDHRATARLVAELDAKRQQRLRRRRLRPLLRRSALAAVALLGGIVLGIVVAWQIGL